MIGDFPSSTTTQEMFELLLGENLAGRKEFIAEEGYKYLDLTDIS